MHIKPIKMRWATGGVNYSYLLSTQDNRISWLIDPAESDEVEEALESTELDTVTTVANTHHHYDHSEGNLDMKKILSGKKIEIVAGSKVSPGATIIPNHLDKFQLGSDIEIKCIRTPCHTQDSICYYVKDKTTNEQAVFTGDTLFTAGCGRFFEGDGNEMNIALNETLLKGIDGIKNAKNVMVYPGHEYTKDNVKFVRKYVYTKIGENPALDQLEAFCEEHEMTTGRFTLEDELQFNPFMRLDDPLVRSAVKDENSNKIHAEVMTKLREMKNRG
ncbi:Cytoplasmic glyoxalase II [Monosporozyma unispora]|nr:Cytoplasmic glyoxalase II [Kazachstania unispora]